jgi:cytochrome c oxidase assembly protein subunit 15
MGGEVVPAGYSQLAGWWTNALENPVAAQFHHRVLAILTGIAAIALAWRAGKAPLDAETVRAVRAVGAVALVQVALGIVTLLLAVPIVLGVLHQLVGVMALSAGVLALHQVQGGPPGATPPEPDSRALH